MRYIFESRSVLAAQMARVINSILHCACGPKAPLGSPGHMVAPGLPYSITYSCRAPIVVPGFIVGNGPQCV